MLEDMRIEKEPATYQVPEYVYQPVEQPTNEELKAQIRKLNSNIMSITNKVNSLYDKFKQDGKTLEF